MTARGQPHLIVGNFSNQMLGLYHNEGNGLFVDEAPRSAVGRASLLNLTFGLFFFDYDLDGYPISSRPTATSKKRSAACSPKFVTNSAVAVPQPGQWNVPGGERAFPTPLVARGRPTAISTATAIWTC